MGSHGLELKMTSRAEVNWRLVVQKLLAYRDLGDFNPRAEDISKALSIPRWEPHRFLFQGALPYAKDRPGRKIELYTDGLTGRTLAAKRWMLKEINHRMAQDMINGDRCSLKNPLSEVVLVPTLSGGEVCGPGAGICACHGAFVDERGDVLLLTEHVPGGGLEELSRNLGPPGPERSARAWPAALALLRAVEWLNARGVAHLNVSLGCALLRPGPHAEVALTDLEGALAGGRRQMTCIYGRNPLYRPPEMWGDLPWDSFAADFWACGIAAFILAVGTHPWNSAEPGTCWSFTRFAAHGLPAFLRDHCAGGAQTPLAECLSPRMAKLLEVLLSLRPLDRAAATAFLA